jgi:hypothetical protein
MNAEHVGVGPVMKLEPQVPRSASPGPLSKRLWGLDWSNVLPWDFGDATVEVGTFADALPFMREYYPRIFGIERWASRRESRSLFKLAASGQLTKDMVTRYIGNVTWTVGFTPTHLCMAREEARARGDEALARHFEHKLGEEEGHAAWGEADLDSLSREVASPVAPAITPAFRALAKWIETTISEDPSLYLPYIAFTEYVTVLLGPGLLQDIEDKCGVPMSSMSIVANHVELDREHAEEGFGVMDDLCGDPRKLAPMRASLAAVLALFDEFCEQVTEARQPAVEPSRAHVSAA